MHAKPTSLITLLAAAALSGCATPETRLKRALVEAGFSEPMAACMAVRMIDRLSYAQLYRLSDLKNADGARSTDEFLHRVRSLRDGQIWIVTASSVAHCAPGRAI